MSVAVGNEIVTANGLPTGSVPSKSNPSLTRRRLLGAGAVAGALLRDLDGKVLFSVELTP